MRYRNVRRGNVSVFVAISLIPLFGAMAFTLDLGMLMDNHRKVQTAADIAALAGATEKFSSYNANGTSTSNYAFYSAILNAQSNGFSYTNPDVTVTVNQNPTIYAGGQFKGTVIPKGYIEVLITYKQPRYFGKIWGSSKLQVSGYAVAKAFYQAADPGMLMLDPNGKASLKSSGNGKVVLTNNGAFVVNSNNPEAAVMSGNGNLQASSVYITGSGPGFVQNGSGTFLGADGTAGTAQINVGVTPTPDPFATLPVPKASDYSAGWDPTKNKVANNMTISSSINSSTPGAVFEGGDWTLHLKPGTYKGGIGISAGSGKIVLDPNPDGSPGIYYMDGGGFKSTGGAKLFGSNVMIYNDGGGTVQVTGQGDVNLTPPTSGVYKGMVIMQEPTSTKTISMQGNVNQNFNITGTLYAAKGLLSISGNGGLDGQGNPKQNIGSQYVVWDFDVTGNGSFNVAYSGGEPVTIRKIQLVQ